jgi:hypothetical protein
MLTKVDVRQIVADHLGTLTNYATGKKSPGDMLLFFLVPLVGAAVLVWLRFLLNANAANVLITALSIFAGLLFNLLVLAHGLLRSADNRNFEDERGLIREIYSNISYAILISLITIVVLLGLIFPGPRWAWMIASGVAYYLILNFILTLFMVLKRVHVLLSKEFQRG